MIPRSLSSFQLALKPKNKFSYWSIKWTYEIIWITHVILNIKIVYIQTDASKIERRQVIATYHRYTDHMLQLSLHVRDCIIILSRVWCIPTNWIMVNILNQDICNYKEHLQWYGNLCQGLSRMYVTEHYPSTTYIHTQRNTTHEWYGRTKHNKNVCMEYHSNYMHRSSQK